MMLNNNGTGFSVFPKKGFLMKLIRAGCSTLLGFLYFPERLHDEDNDNFEHQPTVDWLLSGVGWCPKTILTLMG